MPRGRTGTRGSTGRWARTGRGRRGLARRDEWRERHPGLHAHDVLLRELRARYDEVALEWVPYLSRWLGGPSSAGLEQTLIDAGAIPAIGYRWAGSRTS